MKQLNQEEKIKIIQKIKRIGKIYEGEENIMNYDKIVLLYGVWWYAPSAPIITFLEENDLSGKTIIPCSTNAGWLGHSLKDIEKMCPNSNVVNGISIKFGMDHNTNEILTPEKEIDEWIEKI